LKLLKNNDIKSSDEDLLKLVWNFLAIESPLAHADVIIVGGSRDTNVASYASDLYATGFAPIIVFSGGKQPEADRTDADIFASIAQSHGVSESAIIRETTAANAGQTIVRVQQLLEERDIHPKTVLLIHKPYMSRPFLATAEAQWPDPKPIFTVRHEQVNFIEYMIKQGRGDVFREVLGDFQRMRPYAKKGFQSPQVIPDEVQAAYDTLVWRGHKTR
jgi:uncharacterized SAM-binding protein YcdF (DUF218 family)